MQIRQEIDMEEWINAVTLSLNAEMEREKKLQEEAMEKLAEVLEGEDLDAIEAAIEEAVAKGVAEEALAKARATHKKLERKQRGSRFSRGSRASRASRASRDSLPDEERSVKSDVLSVHADGGAPARRRRRRRRSRTGGPALVGGRSDGTGRAAQDVARALDASNEEEAQLAGSVRRRRPCRRRAPPSPEKAAPLPWNAGRARRDAGRGARRGIASRKRRGTARPRPRGPRPKKGVRRGRGRARRGRGAPRGGRGISRGRREEKAAADELAARAAKPQIDAILADRDTSKQQKILAINRLKDLPATVKQRAMQAAQTGKDFTI